jgi:predicted DNA-binding protein (UPF0251 family)
MKNADLEKFIQSLSHDLYSMAFVLIPDDLQASQLMIDSVQAFLIKKSPFHDILEQGLSSPEEFRESCKMELLKNIYELSKKRYHQLKLSFRDMKDPNGFFSLELDEKAALYLKEHAHCSLEKCEFILAKSRTELLAHLYSARTKMAENINTDMILGQFMQPTGN